MNTFSSILDTFKWKCENSEVFDCTKYIQMYLIFYVMLRKFEAFNFII